MLFNQSNFIINSPLEQFEVVSLLSFNAPIFGYFTLSLTNLALYFILIEFFILGFITNYLIFILVLLGFFGKQLNNILLDKLNRKDLNWFNYLLIKFIIIYFIIIFTTNNIYLDTTINVKFNEIDLNITGDYIEKIFTQFGAATAFVIGSRLAAAFVMKHPISLGNKIGITIGAGAGSSFAFQMANYTTGSIRGRILAQNGLSEGSVNLHIKDVVVSDGTTSNNIVNNATTETIDPNILIPQFKLSLEDKFSKLSFLNDKFQVLNVKNSKSKIIEMIEKQNNCSLNELWSRDNNIDSIIINSPLESTDIAFSNLKNDLITILTYNLTVNLIMVYLICMLIFIFIFKYFLDEGISLEKIDSLPLGFFIKYILKKLIVAWKNSSIFWIFFILFFLLIFSSSSAYAIYGCLFILK